MTAPTRGTDVRRRLRRARRRAVAATTLLAVRARLRVLERLAPDAADRFALDLWCRVPPGGRTLDLRPDGGEVVGLPVPRGGQALAEVWGEGPVVYLLHGWGGWRGHLGALVEPLVQAGYRVVAIDAPGHGEAGPGMLGPGRGTVMEVSEALDAAVARFGDEAAAVVAHSMGTVVATHALADGRLRADRLVLVAASHAFTDDVALFTRTLRLRERTRDHLVATLEEITGRELADFDLVRAGGGFTPPPTLVVHDRTDRRTPYRAAQDVAAAWPDVRLVTTEGYGHTRLLGAPETVASTVAHVTGAEVVPAAT